MNKIPGIAWDVDAEIENQVADDDDGAAVFSDPAHVSKGLLQVTVFATDLFSFAQFMVKPVQLTNQAQHAVF